MDSDREKFGKHADGEIAKETKTLDSISKENVRLQKEVAKKEEKPKVDMRQQEMMRLNDQLDVYTRKIEVEQRKVVELNSQIEETKHNIAAQQKDILLWSGRSGVANAAKDSNQAIQKQIRQLENRLEKALVKFNEALAHNKELEEEMGMKKKLIKGTWAIARDKASMHVQAEKVQTYEEAFARIMDATNIHSIDELVDTFINAEDKNFTLFNFVNELTSEIEKLEEQIQDIKAEVEKYRGQDMNSDHQRKKILKDLEEKLGRTETKAEQYDAKFAHSTKILGSLKDGIHSIFSNIGCNMSGVSEVLGTGGVTEGNIMTYLGLIEQRANEMLAINNQVLKAREGDDTRGALAPGPQAAAGATHINILPPTTGDEYDEEEESEDDDETRPLTREELKARAQKQMTKKEASAKKKSRSKTKGK